jgi:hypothetical protein
MIQAQIGYNNQYAIDLDALTQSNVDLAAMQIGYNNQYAIDLDALTQSNVDLAAMQTMSAVMSDVVQIGFDMTTGDRFANDAAKAVFG